MSDRHVQRLGRGEIGLLRLPLLLPDLFGAIGRRVHRLPRGRRSVAGPRRIGLRPARDLVDDAVHPMVLPDDRPLLRQRARLRRGDRVSGDQVVSEEIAELRIQQGLVLEQRERE